MWISRYVATLKELKVLIIHGNEDNERIGSLQGLDNLTNLKVLSLREHKIQKIKGLQNLKNLEKLDLSMNEISKIEGIENLKNLKKIELGDNKLTKIENLNSLTYLEELYLQRNQILKIVNIGLGFNGSTERKLPEFIPWPFLFSRHFYSLLIDEFEPVHS